MDNQNQTNPISSLLRKVADMIDRGECGADGEEFARVAELHLRDHDRINSLTDIVLGFKDMLPGNSEGKAVKIKMTPRNDK